MFQNSGHEQRGSGRIERMLREGGDTLSIASNMMFVPASLRGESYGDQRDYVQCQDSRKTHNQQHWMGKGECGHGSRNVRRGRSERRSYRVREGVPKSGGFLGRPPTTRKLLIMAIDADAQR